MKQYAIIGMGRFGRSVAHTLNDLGYQVLAIDNNSKKVNKVLPSITRTVECDATIESALRASGIKGCEVVVVAVGSITSATRIITLLKDMNIKHIIARADNMLDKRILKAVGADKVVLPEYGMGKRLARSISAPNLKEFIELSKNIGIVEFTPFDSMFNKSIRELDLQTKYEVFVVALKSNNNELYFNPCGADVIREGQSLLIIGDIVKLQKLRELK